MITYRLVDSLPEEVLRAAGSAGDSPAEEIQRRKMIESFLDRDYGSCILKSAEVASLLIDN